MILSQNNQHEIRFLNIEVFIKLEMYLRQHDGKKAQKTKVLCFLPRSNSL